MIKIKEKITADVNSLEFAEKINYINELREHIHNLCPFKNEPVDYVKWVLAENVIANDYNPNKVAPPEMELLEISIMNDGYTQPVVTYPNNGKIEVVDGFHRTRVSKESKIVRERVKGYTPTVIIRKEQSDKNDRIASTIRHNRARGKHQVDAMSEIILELKNRNWKNERIARELGMDEEEILRLCQITGLQDIFKDDDFSKSWESSDSIANYEPLTDILTEEEMEHCRTVNTSDPDRIFHTFEKWECYKAGFYGSTKEGMKQAECERVYADFLSNDMAFRDGLQGVLAHWINSCEHYRERFKKFIKGWQDRGYLIIPDEAPEDLESKCWVPSWRRMCKVMLRNDYWCKGLGQTQPLSDAYAKFKEIKNKRKLEANL